MTSKEKVLKMLNEALAQEHACHIRYLTHAAVVTGPYAEPVASRLKEIAADEDNHAVKLRDRIAALGGTPTMEVAREDLIPARTLGEILAVNLKEEDKAIALYRSLLRAAGDEGEILYETIEEILQDEQEHKEELERLRE
jgi:bacterioferritin